MMIQEKRQYSKCSSAAASAGIAVTCLGILIMILTGLPYFLNIVAAAWPQIAFIAILAGIIRAMFRKKSVMVTIVCGVLVATAGYCAVILWAVSRI